MTHRTLNWSYADKTSFWVGTSEGWLGIDARLDILDCLQFFELRY